MGQSASARLLFMNGSLVAGQPGLLYVNYADELRQRSMFRSR